MNQAPQRRTAARPAPKLRARRWPAVLLGLVLAMAASTPASGASACPRLAVGGWLPYWDTSAAISSASSARGVLSEASPFWYAVSATGEVSASPGGYSPAALAALRATRDRVIPTVTEAMDAPTAAAYLGDPARRRALADTLADLPIRYGYDGLDLDFENLNFGGDDAQSAAARSAFTAFVHDLACILHARHRELTVTVGARTSAEDGAWQAFDLAAIGRLADRVRVMAYDQHVVGGAPGPVAAADWAARVLAYTVSLVPAGKVELGVPAYGYEWAIPVAGTCPTSDQPSGAVYAAREAFAVAGAHRARIAWDPVAAERTFSYPDPTTYTGTDAAGRLVSCRVNRVVWFADASSAAADARLAERYRLAGIVVWALGTEDPAEWTAIHSAQ